MRRFLFVWTALVLTFPAIGLRLEPLPEAAAHPASGAPLDQDGLIELSLVLSGVPSPALSNYRATLDRWGAEFQAQMDPAWDEAKKAEAVLLALHSHLKAYSTYQTRIDVLIDEGTFNCVSSALAYMILGRGVGLDVQAVATADHAFALVRLTSGRNVDVETTTKYGFDPGNKVEFTNSFGQTGFVYVPPGNYSRRKTINDRQLLGLLVQNRMADFQSSGHPEEAVGPSIDRWIVEGTPEAFRTLVDGFVNYASWINGKKEYSRGLDLVDEMVGWTGPTDDAKQLAWAFLNNQVNLLLDQGDFAGAQALTATWRSRGFLTEAQLAQIASIITDNQLTSAVKTQPTAQAAAQVDQAFTQGSITSTRRLELLSYLYGQAVQKLASEKGPQAAWTFLQTLPDEIQTSPALVKAKEVYAYNWGVEVHNRFAQLWNAGRRDEARQVLKEALDAIPNNSMLKNDLGLSQANP